MNFTNSTDSPVKTEMNITDTTDSPVKLDKFQINPWMYDVFIVFNHLICGEIIGILGIMGNIVNIINFYRQGFSDSVTVTLTALAVSDLGALVTLQGLNFIANPWLTRSDLDFTIFDIAAIFFFYPHGYFNRASGLITAFAALERCASVILPLKVKIWFTKRVALMVNVSIFVTLSLYLFPFAYVLELGYMVVPATNRTILTRFYRNNAEHVLQVTYLLTDLTLPHFTIIVNVIFTVIIIVQLKIKAKWRSSLSSYAIAKQGGQESAPANKEKRTTVMLVTVSVTFIACLVPHSSVLTALSVFREMKVGGAYFDLSVICYSFTFLLEAINCSVSCVIYYRMSSKYRAVAKDMLRSVRIERFRL